MAAVNIYTLDNSQEGLKKCSACGMYFPSGEGVRCYTCRKDNLCKSHWVPEERACTSCMYEQKADQAHVLAQQESSLTVFLRFLQFMFLVFAIFFITLRSRVTWK